MSSHGKFQQKLKDFQSAIDLHNSESDKFEESIHNLLERLLQITNDIDE